MRIYWAIDMIPELSVFPKKERGEIWRRFSFKGFRHWQTWAGYLLCELVGLWLGLVIFIRLLPFIIENAFISVLLVLPLIPAVIFSFVAFSIHVEQVRPYLQEYVKNG